MAAWARRLGLGLVLLHRRLEHLEYVKLIVTHIQPYLADARLAGTPIGVRRA